MKPRKPQHWKGWKGSRYPPGVYWHNRVKKFQARVRVGKTEVHLGYYVELINALVAQNTWLRQNLPMLPLTEAWKLMYPRATRALIESVLYGKE
jgi:hypothetical protein